MRKKASEPMSMPAVARCRAPCRSERVPDRGPMTKNPAIMGSM
jgi:hypothetical protein